VRSGRRSARMRSLVLGATGVVMALSVAGGATTSAAGTLTQAKLQHTDRHVGLVQPFAANQSSNWSGYNQGALEQGTKLFRAVSGQWVVPTATQHSPGQAEYSSTWIGIGGGCVDAGCNVTDPTLIQTGTEQDVAADGTPTYDAWFELIPAPELIVTNVAVHPGDTVQASISSPADGLWTISLQDVTDGQGFTQTVPYVSTLATAEWIQETPLLLGTNAGFSALPDLTTTNFDLATTNGAPAQLQSSEQMQLIDSSGKVIMAPSAPDPDVDGFNVCAWATSCPAPSTS
jgi:hypothetical protein